MSVTEKLMAPGVFNVSLDLSLVPNSILTAIQPYDQIIITNNPMETQDYIDSVMLPTAEYVGVVTSLGIEPEVAQIEGAGLNLYLGDAENRGMPVTDVGTSTAARDYSAVTLEYFINNDDGAPYGILRRNDNGELKGVWPGTITEKSDEETDLLLNFENPTSNIKTTDETEHKHKLTCYLGAEIDSDQAKYGSKSLDLSAPNSHAKVDYHPTFHPSGDDFTIEWWEYRIDPTT